MARVERLIESQQSISEELTTIWQNFRKLPIPKRTNENVKKYVNRANAQMNQFDENHRKIMSKMDTTAATSAQRELYEEKRRKTQVLFRTVQDKAVKWAPGIIDRSDLLAIEVNEAEAKALEAADSDIEEEPKTAEEKSKTTTLSNPKNADTKNESSEQTKVNDLIEQPTDPIINDDRNNLLDDVNSNKFEIALEALMQAQTAQLNLATQQYNLTAQQQSWERSSYRPSDANLILEFSGELKDYKLFKDCFRSTIDNSPLPVSAKFALLVKKLKGDAAKEIENIEANNDASYSLAWQRLDATFQNRLTAAEEYLISLQFHPTTGYKKPATLIDLSRKYQNVCHNLRGLKYKVDDAEWLLAHIIMSRLDDETRRRLMMHARKTNEFPTLAEIDKFFEREKALAFTRKRIQEI